MVNLRITPNVCDLGIKQNASKIKQAFQKSLAFPIRDPGTSKNRDPGRFSRPENPAIGKIGIPKIRFFKNDTDGTIYECGS